MKRLLMFRHSLKDGVRKDTIGPKGFALASAQGEILLETKFDLVAYGRLFRTRQTVVAMLAPQGFIPNPEDLLEIEEFGTEELFAQITGKPGFRDKAKDQGNYRAVLATSSKSEVARLKQDAEAGIHKVFDRADEGETALAVGHSPIIELALSYMIGDLPKEYAVMNEMDGIELEQDKRGSIRVVRKIPAPKMREPDPFNHGETFGRSA